MWTLCFPQSHRSEQCPSTVLLEQMEPRYQNKQDAMLKIGAQFCGGRKRVKGDINFKMEREWKKL